jgi:hypothetical protein
VDPFAALDEAAFESKADIEEVMEDLGEEISADEPKKPSDVL